MFDFYSDKYQIGRFLLDYNRFLFLIFFNNQVQRSMFESWLININVPKLDIEKKYHDG